MKTKAKNPKEKQCSKCEEVKLIDEFDKHDKYGDGRKGQCRECKKEYYSQRYKNKREELLEYHKKYRQDNKEERNKRVKERRANDTILRLREGISTQINHMLRKSGSSKNRSIMEYLPYTMEQLKEHLENQFEPWMTWENRTDWHLDHIYPQSKLPYDSMTHPNFQKAWALENLQPLEAKKNISKGNKVLDK